MRNIFALCALCLLATGVQACHRCAPLVRASVFNADFLANLLVILSPLVLIVLAAAALHRWGEPS